MLSQRWCSQANCHGNRKPRQTKSAFEQPLRGSWGGDGLRSSLLSSARGLQLQKQQGRGKETSSKSSLGMLQPSPGNSGLIIPYFGDPAGVCSNFNVHVRLMLRLAAALVGASWRTEPRSENSLNRGVSSACTSAGKKISPC